MKTLAQSLIVILVLTVAGSAWADPPATEPAMGTAVQQPNYTLYYIHSIGNGTLVVHSCLTPTQFTVSTDEQAVVIRLDGTTGKLSDLKVGQWVKFYRKGDRNDGEHQRIAKIELSMRGQVAAAKLAFDTYSGYFVSNKFEPDSAESFMVITDQEQFDKVFGVAFVMGDKSHRLPKDAFKSLMVVAAIKRGGAVVEYMVEGVTEAKGVVELRYTTTSTKSGTTTFACPLIISIPKGKYTAVHFVESGNPVKKVGVSSVPIIDGTQGKDESRFEGLLSKDAVVPKGVVYKKAGADPNRKALEKLSQLFRAADHKDVSDELFSRILISGPGLWRSIKDDAEMRAITTGVTRLKVPTGKGMQGLEGKLFQSKEEVAAFWKSFLRHYKLDSKAVIRRPAAKELALYWAMIPYDIVEPIFMVENENATILAQFSGEDLKIGWIDDYKNMHVR